MIAEEIPDFISNKHNLVYNNTNNTTDILNILLISSNVYESKLFYDSANPNTFPIIYSPDSKGTELIELLRAKFQNGIQRISFVFHDPLNNIKTFVDDKPFFDEMDLIEDQTTFSQNVTFLTQLITEFRVINCDFLACGTLQYSSWTRYYDLLNRLTGVICGASNDNTGNIHYGANWIMENTNENIRDLYFTSSIVNYASSLSTFTVDYIVYTIGSGQQIVNVSGSVSTITTANIPTEVIISGKSYTVTSIGSRAFDSRTALTTVTIPNSVTTIGNSAFFYCISLTMVTIGSSVTTIGTSAFALCNGLQSITIPNSVTTIGAGAFFNSGLRSITIPNSVTTINTSAFDSCTALTTVTIPNSVTTIGDYAFYKSGLKSITIPNSVTTINTSAFAYCTALLTVTIPNSVTTIGAYAFYESSGLKSISIPNSVTTIGAGAFAYCTALTKVTIPGSVTNLGTSAFLYCNTLESVEFDDHKLITTLGSTVFNAKGIPPLNKTVIFWKTADYGALTPNGKKIAGYFSATPSTETTYIQYDSGASCFNEDTKILCLNRDGHEEYIPIQNLRKGDMVKSYLHGYRKIDLIGKGRMMNNIDVWNDSMYILEKTDDNGLIEDLIVTGGHAILVDQLSDQDLQNYKLNNVFGDGQPIMIDDKFLLLAGLSSLFKQVTEQKKFTYYHLILESNHDDERFGVYANGILTETPSKKQFTAHPYTLL